MTHRIMRINFIALTIATTLAAPAAWATTYNLEPISYTGTGTIVSIGDINAAGRIVGSYNVAGTNKVFGFTGRDGTFSSVGESLPCRRSGRCATAVVAVNNR